MIERPKPVVLAILDGWGVAADTPTNAITQAKIPHIDRFVREYPVMTLHASGNEVGLQFGEMGNSEVGHLNIGAGRVYYQTFPRINKSIENESFFQKSAFVKAAEHVKEKDGALHLMGLVSSGNIHASQEHLYALLKFAKEQKIKKVFVHVFLDGRDTDYNMGIQFVKLLQDQMKEIGVGKIATLSGRYYAMDRDNRWDRIQKAYNAIALGKADVYDADPIHAIQASYDKKVYDEEFIPMVISSEGKPVATVQSGDSIIFFNFRSDRARQLTEAFVLPGFMKFERTYIKDIFFATMTEYEKGIPIVTAFQPVVVHNCLSEVISNTGLTQFHIAETEKYAHVTFFLNGTVEDPFPGEEREIIPSPKVSTYDQSPEMSASKITKEVVKAIEAETYDVIILNFANADMVGHTGDFKAVVKGIEIIDKGLGTISEHVLAHDGVFLITADHGNAEEMQNLETHDMDKEHSTNPVPFFIIGKQYRGQAGPSGDPPGDDLSLLHPVGLLADVAPTVLKILGIEKPEQMDGRALI